VKAARFYASFGITEEQFRKGVPEIEVSEQPIEIPSSGQNSVLALDQSARIRLGGHVLESDVVG
jgi:hypothetical protein